VVKASGREMVTCGSAGVASYQACFPIAVGAGTLEIAIVVQNALEVFLLYLYLFTLYYSNEIAQVSRYAFAIGLFSPSRHTYISLHLF